MSSTQLVACACSLVCSTFLWGEQVSLFGSVLDKRDGSPIEGVDVRIGNKPKATSNDQGRYLVPGLQPNQKITVVCRKGGYVELRPQVVQLVSPKTEYNPWLFKDDDDIAYWHDWSAGVLASVQKQTSDPRVQSKLYAQEWKDIEESSLSPAAKGTAARQLGDVLPPKVSVPPSLLAYRQVDNKMIEVAQSKFHLVLTGDEALRNVHFDIPGTVAADVAAKQVGAQIRKVGKQYKVPKGFIGDFQIMWGADNTNRFKTKVAIEQAILKLDTT
jgi:Carboxypeptidase regulatory-like domain